MQLKPTILITGANGLLGQKLVAELIKNTAYDVVATGRGEARMPPEWVGYEYVPMDICCPEQINEVFKTYRPEFVIHCASMTDVDQCERDKASCLAQNVDAVSHMVDACESTRSHLIHLSTDFIFNGEDGPYTEEDIPSPVNYYGHAKLLSEKIVQASSINWAIVRTGLVYGITSAMTRSNIVLWVKTALEGGKELHLVDDQIKTPTLAEDLAIGCIKIVEREALGIFNISGEEVLTPYQMGIQVAQYFGLDLSKIKKSDSSLFTQTARRPLKTGFLVNKAIDRLEYCPRSFTEGIKIIDSQLREDYHSPTYY